MLVKVLISIILFNGLCHSFEFESNQSNEQRNKRNILNPKVKHPYAQTFICPHNKIYRFGKCREEKTENPESAQVVQEQTNDYLTSKDFNKGLLEVVTFKSVVLLSIMMFLIIVCYAFKGKISQRYTPTSTENAELTSVSSVEVSTDKMIFRTQDSDSVMISN